MTLEEKVDKLIEDVTEIKTALKYNGMGLIPTFEQHCIQDRELRQDYYKFKRWGIGILCFLIGSGAIGVSVWEIFK